MNKLQKLGLIFGLGLVEQFGYTLYLLAVNRYMIFISSILMFSYMAVYLWLINTIAKDKTYSIQLLFAYALASGLGNCLAMIMHLIK